MFGRMIEPVVRVAPHVDLRVALAALIRLTEKR